MQRRLRVATYNVLCGTLAAPATYPHNHPSDLEPGQRLAALLTRLAPELDARSVLCLQEVGASWVGPLHAALEAANYSLVVTAYGRHFNDHMGVALAYPRECFSAVEVNAQRVAPAGQVVAAPSAAPLTLHRMTAAAMARGGGGMLAGMREVGSSMLARVGAAATVLWRGPPALTPPKAWYAASDARLSPPAAVWQSALRRENMVLMARLVPIAAPEGAEVVVATYHMPCAWQQPAVMQLHAAWVAARVHAFAGDAPYVLAGDWNMKPEDGVYALLTRGAVPPDHPHAGCLHSTLPPEVRWAPGSDGPTLCHVAPPLPLASAYVADGGREPPATYHAFTEFRPGTGSRLTGTLDYLFFTPQRGLVVLATEPLPHPDSLPLLPSLAAAQPSDHLLLAADFALCPQPCRSPPLPPPATAAAVPKVGTRRQVVLDGGEVDAAVIEDAAGGVGDGGGPAAAPPTGREVERHPQGRGRRRGSVS